MLSFVHLIKQNKLIATAYKKTQQMRRDTIRSNFSILADQGFIKPANDEVFQFLTSTVALISRFWLSEAAISFRVMTSDDQIRYYLKLITDLLLPYATAKGKKEIEQFNRRFRAH
jgi:hypothetical protein